MKTITSLLCAAALFATSSQALAGAYGEPEQAEEMPRPAPVAEEVAAPEGFEPFFYAAIGGVYGQGLLSGDAHQINKHYGWGVNGRAGYRFMEMLAVELLFEDVIEFDADSGDGTRTNIDRRAWTAMPNLKFFPIQGRCEPYLSVGAGLIHADAGRNNEIISATPLITTHNTVDDGYGFAARFGGGADFYVTKSIFVEAEAAYVLPFGDAGNYDHVTVSLGLGYAFN